VRRPKTADVEVEGRLSERKSAGDRLTTNSTPISIKPKPDRRRAAEPDRPSENSKASPSGSERDEDGKDKKE